MPLLAVSSATSLTENSVRVTYDAAVQFSGTWEPGDAGDPKNYEITAAGLTYEVSSVAAVEGSTTSVDLFLREVLPVNGTLTVTGVRSALGDELGGSNTATIRALPYRQPALVDAVAGGVRDIANVNGVWFIDRGGDFTTDVGLVQLRKRLFRRLSTPKNAISHLPGYGVNVAAYIKQLASASARTRLIADIEQQFSQEPEVLSTSATLTQFGNRGLWRLRVLVRTRFGTTLRPEYDVGVLGGDAWSFPVTPGSPTFTPTALSGCTWWLRADKGILLNAGNVASWADQSGVGDANRNAVQATPAKQPPWAASNAQFNNQPTVNCTTSGGVGRYLFADAWGAPVIAGDMTFFIVARRANSTANNRYLYDGGDPSGTVQFAMYEDNTASSHYFNHTGAGNYASRSGDLLTASAIILRAKNGQNADVRVNSTAANHTTTGNPGPFAPDGITVGGYSNGGPYSDFEIAEMAMWLRQLTQNEINQLNAYAASRYGMTIT